MTTGMGEPSRTQSALGKSLTVGSDSMPARPKLTFSERLNRLAAAL